MEFKLNKIDTDIRRKLQEEIREGKVHGNNSITVKKDLKEERNNKDNTNNRETSSKSKKEFFIVDGVKYKGKTLNIDAEKTEFIDSEKLKGHTLDVKK